MNIIDLSELPRRGKYIDWKNSIGCKCKFVYDDIEDEVEIVDYEYNKKPIIIFKYKHETHKMNSNNFSRCKFGNLLGKITNEFKIEIETVFKDNKRDITVTDRKYRKRKHKNGTIECEKWYKYTCNECGWTEGWINEYNLLKGNGCSCCCDNHRVVVQGINDIPTTAPWMVKYFQGGIEEASKYTKSSNKCIYPICPYCGRVKSKPIIINKIYNTGSIGCVCGGDISMPEKIMFYVLESLNIDFIFQLSKKDFDWCKNYRYDFYIPKYNIIVETHGSQHYRNCGFSRTIENEQENDKIKKDVALSNNIEKYIVINCKRTELNYIKKNILNSDLSKLYDLSKINWLKIYESSTKNLIKEVCKYYEENQDLTQNKISEMFKLSISTINRYLKQGEKLGWCNYRGNKKKVLCVELNEEFESIHECARELTKRYGEQFYSTNISSVCRCKLKSHRGFSFSYI